MVQDNNGTGPDEKTVGQAIHYRRSVRVYDPDQPIDPAQVRSCLALAALAPNSSNMQLWEFYHITAQDTIAKMAPLCFNQNAARTADQLVVFVVRKDLWRQRAKANLDMINKLYPQRPQSEQSRRERVIRLYYSKLMPHIYFDFLGFYGLLKYLMILVTGLFKPIYREVRAKDMRVVVHKTCALAAQNFMLSMAAKGYDTCPMEGVDTWRVKKLLDLPRGAEINMIVSCGVRKPEGVYGERFRVPFEEVYKSVDT
jgi:nitroreductase